MARAVARGVAGWEQALWKAAERISGSTALKLALSEDARSENIAPSRLPP